MTPSPLKPTACGWPVAACLFRSTGGPTQRKGRLMDPITIMTVLRRGRLQKILGARAPVRPARILNDVPVVRRSDQRWFQHHFMLPQQAVPVLHAAMATGWREELRHLRYHPSLAERGTPGGAERPCPARLNPFAARAATEKQTHEKSPCTHRPRGGSVARTFRHRNPHRPGGL